MAAMGGHHRPKDLGHFRRLEKNMFPVEKGCSCEVAMLVVFEALGQTAWFRGFDLKAYLLFFF